MQRRKSNWIITVAIVLASLALSGCLSTEIAPETQEAAAKVRFVPESRASGCSFISQTNLTQDNSFFGAETTEQFAQAKLRLRAVNVGANAVAITERLFDKGRGGYDKTRISYFANLYRC